MAAGLSCVHDLMCVSAGLFLKIGTSFRGCLNRGEKDISKGIMSMDMISVSTTTFEMMIPMMLQILEQDGQEAT
jgi:hypothetical protein